MTASPAYRVVDLATWPRREVFHHFKTYADPFFGFTLSLDVSALKAACTNSPHSLTAAYLFASQQSLHQVPEFRLRLVQDEVREYAHVSAGATVMKDDGVFTFCYFPPASDFQSFQASYRHAVANCQQSGTPLEPQDDDPAQIFYSIVPWLNFSSVRHPVSGDVRDTVPRIAFGQVTQVGARWQLPLAVDAHHALMDAVHISQYFRHFQEQLNTPTAWM